MFAALFQKWKMRQYLKQGLQIADDCRLTGLPDFGSEPYLVSIGRHVTITGRVTFITHDGGTWVFRDRQTFREVIKYGRITIHDNCFIGYGTIIMPNVSIGPNAVVAAGSVVTRDIPPDTVVGGVPARPIMSIEEYANKILAQAPLYDRKAYADDKRQELLRLYPRPW